MTQQIFAGRPISEYIAYSKRPCLKHGAVTNEPEWWTSGTHYVCPLCKDTDHALNVLAELIRKCNYRPGFEILASAMRHLWHDDIRYEKYAEIQSSETNQTCGQQGQ
jgi:hypothetical protein